MSHNQTYFNQLFVPASSAFFLGIDALLDSGSSSSGGSDDGNTSVESDADGVGGKIDVDDPPLLRRFHRHTIRITRPMYWLRFQSLSPRNLTIT